MRPRVQRKILVSGVAVAAIALSGCGAGTRTGAETATKVSCNFDKPAKATTVNVLAYNSSAVDPFTNTMVKSCSKNDVTVKHDPIDFGGQKQKTTATLAGDKGTYDIVETYTFIIGPNGAAKKIRPLDDLFTKYSKEYQLDQLDPKMLKGMSYQGKLYGLPMQAQMFVMAYRKDIFDKNGLKPPKTFDDLRAAAKKIKDSGQMRYPLALPLLSTGDVTAQYQAAVNSLGTDFIDPKTKKPQFTSPKAKKGLEEMRSLTPFMDPQVSTFDQPKVQQQLYNGDAAIAVMFSGRMNDLTKPENSKFAKDFAFAAPPTVDGGDTVYSRLSIDGWSIPENTDISPDLLFELIASAVSPDASKASVPAAFPARKGVVTESSSPYAAAALESIKKTGPSPSYPWSADIDNGIISILSQTISGKLSVDEGSAKMQAVAEGVMKKY